MNVAGTIEGGDLGSPSLWQQMADHMPQLAWVADAAGSMIWYNQRWYDYTGSSFEQMAGWGWRAVHHPDHVDRVETKFRAAIVSGEPWEDVFPLRSATGEYRWFLSRANPLRGETGAITHWFGTNTDVTEQSHAEQALRETSERVQLALDAGAIIGTWMWDLPNDRFTVDEKFAANFGLDPAYGREGLSLEQVIETVHPDDKPGLIAAIDEVLSRGGAYAHQYRVRRQDGEYYWIEANGRVDKSPEGTPLRFPGVLLDVHERRLMQEALAQTSRRLHAILDNTTMAVFLMDERQQCVFANAAAEKLTGYTFAQMQGRPLHDVVHHKKPDGSHYPLEECPIDRAFPERAQMQGQELFVAPDGNFYPVAFTASPVLDDHDRPIGTVIEARGIAEELERDAALLASEAAARDAASELEAIFNAAPIGLTVLNRELRYVRINELLAEINGKPAADHIGRHVREMVPDLAEAAEQALRRVLAGEEIWGLEIAGQTSSKPGVGRIWRENWIPMRNAEGEITGVAISADEVTESKAAEIRLREAEQRYRAVFEQAGVGVARVSPDGPFLEINDRYCQILKRSREEILGGGWKEITHPDDLEEDARQVDRIARGEIDSYSLEKRYLAKDGSPIWVNLTVAAERDADGRVLYYIPVVEDIGARKTAESALRASEERYRALFESMEQGFCTIQVTFDGERPVDYRFTELNPAFTEHTGLEPEVLHRSVREAVPGLEEVWFERYGEIARTGVSHRFVEHAEPLGRWFEVYAFRIGDPSEHTVAILFSDITERVDQERALIQSEARLRAVLEAAPVGLVFADSSGKITGGNTRVEAIVGHAVLPSADVDSYGEWISYHADGRQVQSREYPLARVISENLDAAELEVQYQRGDSSLRWVRFSAAPVRDAEGEIIGGVVASIDIDREKRLTESLEREVEKVVAEREAAQEALRQSQKLEAMGQLTGGVAHDFNNLLTPIIGGLDMVHRKKVADPRTQRLIDGALQSAEKARVLVQRLLAFARRQPLQPTAVDVSRVVTDMADLIGSTSGPRVRMEVAVEPDLPLALADSNQLEMALLNLSVNARDAMPDGGTLTIAVRQERATEDNRLGLADAPYVVLSVTDSGTGMDAETQRRAIEPFFSTKGVGKGTGLGLSMVHGLAAQLGGALRINSRPGLGTSIELWLPVADERAEQRTSRAAEVQSTGAGIALLVDDEELVRSTTASMLVELGYEVVEADTAEAALERLKGGLKPALIVTDHLMPGMTGTDMALQIRGRMPSLPILIVSGYAEVESLAGTLPHLTKPFRQDELATALKAMVAT